jgi:hypothetical protein
MHHESAWGHDGCVLSGSRCWAEGCRLFDDQEWELLPDLPETVVVYEHGVEGEEKDYEIQAAILATKEVSYYRRVPRRD